MNVDANSHMLVALGKWDGDGEWNENDWYVRNRMKGAQRWV